ncbi:hypothetical protein FB45DRAFT_957583 [Roridomyces roridus]|uniref:Cell wall galactomannoprotein n=1 Tax=Roridomyces roridus TaxID=1738132 RepID=A0AAD7F854_9AGAR|nr:hypothetical protein FB45DRAFT_957583 [Roridomyces roridus]
MVSFSRLLVTASIIGASLASIRSAKRASDQIVDDIAGILVYVSQLKDGIANLPSSGQVGVRSMSATAVNLTVALHQAAINVQAGSPLTMQDVFGAYIRIPPLLALVSDTADQFVSKSTDVALHANIADYRAAALSAIPAIAQSGGSQVFANAQASIGRGVTAFCVDGQTVEA